MRFLLTVLFLLIGINGMWGQTTTTKTLTFDFKNAETTVAGGTITLGGVEITLGSGAKITNGKGLVFTKDYDEDYCIHFPLGKVAGSTTISVSTTFPSDGKGSLKGAFTSESSYPNDSSSVKPNKRTNGNPGTSTFNVSSETEGDLWLGSNGSSARTVEKIEVTYTSVSNVTVGSPTFVPETGSEINVGTDAITATSTTENASIYWLWGTSTDSYTASQIKANGTLYNSTDKITHSAVSSNTEATLWAAAFDSDNNASEPASATYTILSFYESAPVFASPASGSSISQGTKIKVSYPGGAKNGSLNIKGSLYYQTSTVAKTLTRPTSTSEVSSTSGWTKVTDFADDGTGTITIPSDQATGTLYVYVVGIPRTTGTATPSNIGSAQFTIVDATKAPKATVTWGGTTGTSFNSSSTTINDVTVTASVPAGIVYKWASSEVTSAANGDEFYNSTVVNAKLESLPATLSSTFNGTNTTRVLTLYAYYEIDGKRVYQAEPTVATWTLKNVPVTIAITPSEVNIIPSTDGSTSSQKVIVSATDDGGHDITSKLEFSYTFAYTNKDGDTGTGASFDKATLTITAGTSEGTGTLTVSATSADGTYTAASKECKVNVSNTNVMPTAATLDQADKATLYGDQNVSITNPQNNVVFYYRISETQAYTSGWTDGSTDWEPYNEYISLDAPGDGEPARTVYVSIVAVNSNENSLTAYNSYTYTLTLHKAPNVTFDKSTGSYDPPVTLSITTTENTEEGSTKDNTLKTYYHVRTSNETAAPKKDNRNVWTEYTGPLTLTSTSTIDAFADGEATNSSEPNSVTITVNDNRPSPGLAWDPASLTVNLEDSATVTGAVLTNNYSVEVTYSSSNPTVATVNTDGKVRIHALGTSTITASYVSPSTDVTDLTNYKSQSVSYTLTVTTENTPTVTFYSGTTTKTTLTSGQDVPDGTVVKLDIQNYPSNYVVMVALNDNTPTYPKDKEPDKNYDNNFHYLGRGIPVFTSDNVTTTTDGVSTSTTTINVKVFDPSDKSVKGTHYIKLNVKADGITRPSKPTISPKSTDDASGTATIMTTAESSTSTGETDNMVYAKYSNSLTYSPRVLLAERNIQIGKHSVGVFSTVYNPHRRTTAIQIDQDVTWNSNVYDIASDAAVQYYHYTPNRHKTSISVQDAESKEVDAIEKDINFSTATDEQKTLDIASTYYVAYSVDGTAVSALPSTPGVVSYSYYSSNPSVATVDNEGKVNILKAGTTTITVSTNQVHGTATPRVDGEYVGTQGYDAATKAITLTVTDESAATLVPPTINPPTDRIYHAAFTATVTANKENASKPLAVGDAYYIVVTDNTDYSENAAGIVNSSDVTTVAKGNVGDVPIRAETDGNQYTIWAVTYNSEKAEGAQYSEVVHVTYTYQYIDLPDPVLEPGVQGENYEYVYTTDSLLVTASVAYAGASVYYTIDTPGDIKDINSSNVMLYDGKARINLKRTCTVRAVAYYEGVYSNTVVYNYRKTKTHIDYPFYIDGNSGNVYRQEKNEIDIVAKNGVGINLECRIDADGDGQWDRNSDDYDDFKYYIPTNDIYNGTYVIRYTTDNTTPTLTNGEVWSKQTTYSSTTHPEGLTIKAFCYSTVDGSAGPISSLKLTFTPGVYPPWEANDQTTTKGVLNYQIIDKDVTNDNTETAPRFIRMTIGSLRDVRDNGRVSWSHGDVAGDYKGKRIEGFGSYDIIAKNVSGKQTKDENGKNVDRTNADDENLTTYNHSYAQLNDFSTTYATEHSDVTISTKAKGIYESTFKLPAHGTFVRFEPERDGTVYIWCVMNGGMQWSKNNNTDVVGNIHNDVDIFFNKFIKKRPAYLVDEQGHSVKATMIQAAGTLDRTNWNRIDRSQLLDINGTQDDPTGETEANGPQTNKDFTQEEAQNIYDMYNEKVSQAVDNSKSITDLVTTLNDGTHQTAAGAGTKVNGDNVIDGTGYCIPSNSYMKFAFPLKAGKTYFFFMVNSKVGISALGFKADNTADATGNTELELDESGSSATGSTVESNISKISKILNDDSKKDLTYDVTVKHSFTKGLWTTLVLPFSVSEKQLKEVLGDGVDVIHFTEWDATNKVIKMTRHYYNQMIVAGTPVFIKPDKDIDASTGVKFEGVHIEKPNSKFDDGVENVPASSTDVHMTGNFDKGTLNKNDFYINTRGRLTQLTKSESMNINGMRAWLTGFTGTVSNAKAYVAIVNDSETGDVDGIIRVTVDEDGNIIGEDLKDNIIYNLSGQIVTRDPSRLNTLPRGVYILNGKKVTVK